MKTKKTKAAKEAQQRWEDKNILELTPRERDRNVNKSTED